MENFMNIPEFIEPTANNIIEEYKRYYDVGKVARAFKIDPKRVREILKQAGIKIEKKSQRKTTPLQDVGMSEKDFL